MTDLPQFIDQYGEIRRCGAVPRAPRIPVGAAFEDSHDVYSEDTIRGMLRDRQSDPANQTRMDRLRASGFLAEFTSKANQRSTSGCNGWLGSNGYTMAKFFGTSDPTREVFSGSYQYGWMNGNRDQGSVLEDGYRVSAERGNVTIEQCQWNMIFRHQAQHLDAIAQQNRATDPFPVRSELGLLTAMVQGALGGVAIQAGPNLERGRGGIAPVDRGPGNHAVMILEMTLEDDDFIFWTYLNWGAQHGVEGFVKLTLAHFAQTAPHHLHWVTPVGQHGSQS